MTAKILTPDFKAKKPKNYWKDWNNVESELLEIISEIAHFPTQDELANLDRKSLINAITLHHGGLYEVAVKLGYTPAQRKRGFWKDWDNVEKETNTIINKIGHFPTYTEIEEHTPGIFKGLEYHNLTYNEFRAQMGYSLSRKEPGYWNEEENRIKEAREFMKKHGLDNITSTVLEKFGESSLMGAIIENGGFFKFREKLGLVNEKIENGKWRDENFTIEKAREIKRKHSFLNLPGSSKLTELGYGSFAAAVEKYHGGFHNFREKLGETEIRERMGAWKDLGFTLQRVKSIILDNGLTEFPTYGKLQELGESTVVYAANRHHGGLSRLKEILRPFFLEHKIRFEKIRRERRSEILSSSRKKPSGFWKERQNRVDAMKKVIEDHKLDRLPTYDELERWGHSSLLQALVYYGGGIGGIAKDVGVTKTKMRYSGHWNERGRIVETIRREILERKLDRMPMRQELVKWGYYGMISALGKTHNTNLRDLAPEVGYEMKGNRNGSLKNLEYVAGKIREIMMKNNLTEFPTQEVLVSLGGGSLVTALTKYHNGLVELKKSFGQKHYRTENGVWKDKNFAVAEANKIKKENGWERLPSVDILVKLGHSGLTNAITRFHGGFHKFRKLLGEQQQTLEMGKLKDRTYILQQLDDIMAENNCKQIPTGTQLHKWGYSSIASAISTYHGGFYRLRKDFGEKKKVLPSGTWKNLDFTLQRVKEFIKEHGFSGLPSSNKLREYPHGAVLSQAICTYHGGFPKFRELLGESIPIKSHEKFKEELVKDTRLAMLSGAKLLLNDESSNIEDIMMEVYPGKFKNKLQLHRYIEKSQKEIIEIVNKGLTNLGYFIGDFSLVDRAIFPILIGEALSDIESDKIRDSLEGKIVRTLQIVYSPRFNSNASEVINELESKALDSKGGMHMVYRGLIKHYHEVLRLKENLG